MANRLENLTDAEIVNNLVTDQQVDFTIRFLYRSYFDFLSRYIVSNSGSEEDSQDIFQEVVIAFINLVKAGKFRGESSIKTFLFSLNRNMWLNELKRKGRAEAREMKYEISTERVEQDMGLVVEQRQTTTELMKTIAALGETCKKILLLFYYENKSMKEILLSLNYENEQVVRNKKHKCLKQMEQVVNNNPLLYQQLKTFLHG